MSIKLKFLLILWLLLALLSCVYSFMLYQAQRDEYMAGIDRVLWTAASMAKQILPADYHDRLVDKDSVTPDEYLRIIDRWNRICLENDLQYLWSNLILDEEIVFTSSSSASKDVRNGDHALFFDTHSNPDAFAEVRRRQAPTYSSFHNEWGRGRMLLLPDRDSNGRLYVIGASISTETLNEKLWKTGMDSAILFLSILGLGTLLSYLVAGRISRYLTGISEMASRIAGGEYGQQIAGVKGGRELVSLGNSINYMSRAIHQHNERLGEMVAKRTAELAEQKERAEALARAKSDFLSNMSHEIRTPLNAIIGFAEILEEDEQLAKEQHRQIGAILSSGEHLLELINDILEMSRAEAGHSTLLIRSFETGRFFEELRGMLEQRARGKGIALHIELDPELPGCLSGDLGKLRQVLINLVGNAIKFTSDGGVVLRVLLKERDDERIRLRFEVEDSGSGISNEALERIFDPFQQAAAGAASATGTGLGLSIAREHVRLMGGEIHATSRPGFGSLFYFEAPFDLCHGLPVSEKSTVNEGFRLPEGAQQSVLIADDNDMNRELLKSWMSDVGYQVLEARHGEEAVELANRHAPDLILMDIAMPVMDGLEATRRICQRSPDAKVIAVSASVFEEDRRHVLAEGAVDFLRKPIRKNVLFRKISEHAGIEYRKEAEDVLGPNEDQTKTLSSHAAGETIPQALRERLRGAIKASRLTETRQLIRQAELHAPGLAQTMLEALERFDWDTLEQLIDKEQP